MTDRDSPEEEIEATAEKEASDETLGGASSATTDETGDNLDTPDDVASASETAAEIDVLPDRPDVTGLTKDLLSITSQGKYPLIAFGLDKEGRPDRVLFVTSSIPDMVAAWEMLDRFLPEDYSFSGYVPWAKLEGFADLHTSLVRKHEVVAPGFDANRDFSLLSSLARGNSAYRWTEKAFAVVDIAGFSKVSIEQQLAHRTSLSLALTQASSRVHKLYSANLLHGRSEFFSTSTGDGFYFWHRAPGGAHDVGVFMLLLYVMAQTEAMRRTSRSDMRLRGAFGVGEAYTFPSRDLSAFRQREPSQDAIGPVLNSLARLLSAADPGQILVGDFARSDTRSDTGENLTPQSLLRQAERELLPNELTPTDAVKPQDLSLVFDPGERLRVSDKHGYVHYCYNLTGNLPNRFKPTEPVATCQIGLPPETALDMSMMSFSGEDSS